MSTVSEDYTGQINCPLFREMEENNNYITRDFLEIFGDPED